MPRSGCSALHGVNPNLKKTCYKPRSKVTQSNKMERDIHVSVLELKVVQLTIGLAFKNDETQVNLFTNRPYESFSPAL